MEGTMELAMEMERRSTPTTKQPRELEVFTCHGNPRARTPWPPGALVQMVHV